MTFVPWWDKIVVYQPENRSVKALWFGSGLVCQGSKCRNSHPTSVRRAKLDFF
jgi:hypothetical protein